MKSILVAVALLACAVSAEAQQARKIPRIAFLSQGEIAPPLIEAFLDGLRELGYVEKRTIIIEYGDAKGNPDRLPSLAADLVAEKVDVIVVVGGEATLAAKNATRAIPIVMTVASDPVGSGFVASLARPGGNITGLSAFGPETSGKRLELLKEVVPGFSRLAALAYVKNPAFPSQIREVQDAAKALKVQLQLLEVREAKEFVSAFGAAKKGRALGISTITSAFLSAHRKELVEVAR